MDILNLMEKTIRSWVYFIGLYIDDTLQFVKIGYTGDIDQRLSTLQAYNPYELRVIGKIPVYNINVVQSIEAEIHRECKAYRVRGEWFSAEVLPYLEYRYLGKPKKPWDELLELRS